MFSLVLGLVAVVPEIGVYTCARTAPFHPYIHVLGNVGRMGQVHATFAETATRVIDCVAYKGTDMRKDLAQQVRDRSPRANKVVEVGCGVGTLTRHLGGQFPSVVAVDTSAEMIAVARDRDPTSVYKVQNAIDVDATADVAMACMLFHELPRNAQLDVLHSMHDCVREANGAVWVVDIDPQYVPSRAMLAGEPYMPSYLESISETMYSFAEQGALCVDTFAVIPGHVRAWVLSAESA